MITITGFVVLVGWLVLAFHVAKLFMQETLSNEGLSILAVPRKENNYYEKVSIL